MRWKAKHFCLLKKKKRAGGGSAGGMSHVRGLISRSLYPPEKLLNTACTAEGKAGSSLAGIYFPSSPHCWLNRGSPLKCLWPLEERGRGLIGLFCQIGHTTSTGTVRAHLLAAATACEAESCGAHTASAMSRQLQQRGICIFWAYTVYYK